MDPAVQGDAGQSGVADGGAPVLDGQLTSYDGQRPVAVVTHLQQVVPVGIVEYGQHPFVNHKRVYLCQLLE